MATYDITPEGLRNSASRIDEIASEYENLYSNKLLQSLVGGELKEAYKGTDAEALSSSFEKYRDAFRNVKQLLDDYAEFLRSTATAYENGEIDLGGKARQLQIKS